MSNIYYNDSFERYGDGNEPVIRVNCNALKDPEHEIPTRCNLGYNHTGPHRVKDLNFHVDEEWE